MAGNKPHINSLKVGELSWADRDGNETDRVAMPVVPDDYIPTWDEIGHLLERGQVAQIVYDTETSDTSRNYNSILDLGLVVADNANRPVHTLEVDARVPDHRVIAPQAALVNKRGPEDWDSGVSQHRLAGMFVDAVRNAPKRVYERLTDEDQIQPITKGVMRKEETVRKLYFRDEQGEVQHARLHDKGKYVSIPVKGGKFTYEDADGTKWLKKRSAIGVKHFYGNHADDQWMWRALDGANVPDIFLTHTKKNDARKPGAYRTDKHKVAQMVRLYGPQGEEGLQTLKKPDGSESFRLQDMMVANTRHAVPERGLMDGTRMPDGAEYNELKGHKRALIDALATLGLDTYLRRIAPDLVKLSELNADFETMKDFVHGHDHFQDRPVIGMGRIIRGRAAAHMGMLVDIDEEHGDFKNVLFVRLDVDLPNYTYGGKRLMEMTEDELVTMIKDQRRSPDALFQQEHLRKNPNLVPAEVAYDAGRANGFDPELLEENRRYLMANDEFFGRVMNAWAKSQPNFERAHEIPNALPEEEIFTGIGDLPYYTVKDSHGELRDIPLAIHQRADDARNHGRNVDRQLRMLVEPDALEWDLDREDGLKDFQDKLKRAKKALERYGWHHPKVMTAIDVGIGLKSPEQAVDHIWKMRKLMMGKFNDHSMSYEVQDRNGNQVPFEQIVEMHPQELLSRLDAGSLKVEVERLRSMPSTRKLARAFWEEGRIDELGVEWRQFVEDEIAFYQAGIPNLDPEDQPLMTIPRAKKEVEKLLANERRGKNRRADPDKGEHGQFEQFAAGTDDAVQMLEGLKVWLDDRAAKFPLTDEAKVRMGWDPVTNFPIEHVRYEIEGKDAIVIDVPDKLIDQPLGDRNLADNFMLMYGPKKTDLGKALKAGKSIVVRGAESGKMFLATGATIASAPKAAEFPEVFREAEARYQDSGYILPKNNGQMLMLAAESFTPLANTRAIDETVQAVKVQRQEDFDAMVSPTLGMTKKPLTGLVLREYEFTPEAGKARFQETDADGVETGWELEGDIKSVRKMTLMDLRSQVRRKKFTDKDAIRYGYMGTSDMLARVSKMFDDELVRERRSIGPGSTSDEQFMLVDLERPVKRDTMAYLNHLATPEASIKREFLGDRTPDFDLKKQRKPSVLKSLATAANDTGRKAPAARRSPKAG
ncbi:MAG: hypothetical protein AAF213_02460 [Pseudomonadota bacterium]